MTGIERESEEQVTFGAVFRDAQFRALFGALGLSTIGDFLARGAIALTVYAQTGSASLMAVTYAITFLPDVLGGPFLAGLADRFPRRTVMILADIGRAAVVAVMAIPQVPLPALWGLLVVVRLMDSPFRSAQTAVLSVVLTGERYVLGLSACQAMANLGLALGFVAAGAVVEWMGPSQALLVNAGTFLLSALLVRLGVEHAQAASSRGDGQSSSAWHRGLGASLQWVRREPRLLVLLMFATIPGIGMVTTGLAAPYAIENGAGAAAAGLLMACGSVGTAVGSWALGRLVTGQARLRLLGPLAVTTSAPLVVAFTNPGITVTVVLWFISGAAFAFWAPVVAAAIRAVPDAVRGQMSGLLTAVLRLSQGTFVLVYGMLAGWFPASTVITMAGLIGVFVAAGISQAWRRVAQQGLTGR